MTPNRRGTRRSAVPRRSIFAPAERAAYVINAAVVIAAVTTKSARAGHNAARGLGNACVEATVIHACLNMRRSSPVQPAPPYSATIGSSGVR